MGNTEKPKVIMRREGSKKTISIGEDSVEYMKDQGYTRVGVEKPIGEADAEPKDAAAKK